MMNYFNIQSDSLKLDYEKYNNMCNDEEKCNCIGTKDISKFIFDKNKYENNFYRKNNKYDPLSNEVFDVGIDLSGIKRKYTKCQNYDYNPNCKNCITTFSPSNPKIIPPNVYLEMKEREGYNINTCYKNNTGNYGYCVNTGNYYNKINNPSKVDGLDLNLSNSITLRSNSY